MVVNADGVADGLIDGVVLVDDVDVTEVGLDFSVELVVVVVGFVGGLDVGGVCLVGFGCDLVEVAVGVEGLLFVGFVLSVGVFVVGVCLIDAFADGLGVVGFNVDVAVDVVDDAVDDDVDVDVDVDVDEGLDETVFLGLVVFATTALAFEDLSMVAVGDVGLDLGFSLDDLDFGLEVVQADSDLDDDN